jgi:hypothetical protein
METVSSLAVLFGLLHAVAEGTRPESVWFEAPYEVFRLRWVYALLRGRLARLLAEGCPDKRRVFVLAQAVRLVREKGKAVTA